MNSTESYRKLYETVKDVWGSDLELTPPSSPKECGSSSSHPASAEEAPSSAVSHALTEPPAFRIPKQAGHLSNLTGNKVIRLPVKKTLKLEKERIRREKSRKKTRKLHCKYCDVSGKSQKSFDEHLNSEKHKRQVRWANTDLHCKECAKTFTNLLHYERHLGGKKHLKAVDAVKKD